MSNLQLSLSSSTSGVPQTRSMQAPHPASSQQQSSMQAAANQLAGHAAATLGHKQPSADNSVAIGLGNTPAVHHSSLPLNSHGRSGSLNFSADAGDELMPDQKVAVDLLANNDRHDDPEAGNDADNEAEAEDDMGDEPNSPEDPGSSPADSTDWQRDLVMHRFRKPAPTQV